MLKRQGKELENPAIHIGGNKSPMDPYECMWISPSWVLEYLNALLSLGCMVSWIFLTTEKEGKQTKKQALYFNTDVGFHHGTTSLKVDVLSRLNHHT